MTALKNGWILPEAENTADCKAVEGITIDINDLYAIVSLACGVMVGRCFLQTNYTPQEQKESSILYATILETVDEKLLPTTDKQILRLKENDSAYAELAYQTISLIKDKIKSHDINGISEIFRRTNQFKRWMEEEGLQVASVSLIDNWIHPLALEKAEDGNLVNLWMYASSVCAIASNRLPEKLLPKQPDKMLSLLVDAAVVPEECADTLMQIAQKEDDVYVKLVANFKKTLDIKVQDLINRNRE